MPRILSDCQKARLKRKLHLYKEPIDAMLPYSGPAPGHTGVGILYGTQGGEPGDYNYLRNPVPLLAYCLFAIRESLHGSITFWMFLKYLMQEFICNIMQHIPLQEKTAGLRLVIGISHRHQVNL